MARARQQVGWVAAKDLYVLTVMALMWGVAVAGSARLRDVTARFVANAAFMMSHRKRRGSMAMLERVFGSRMSPRRRRIIVRRAFEEFWLDAFSLPRLRGTPQPAPGAIEGVDHLSRTLDEGHGAILWVSNNFGGMTTLKRTLHDHGFPVHKVHAVNHLGGFRDFGDPDSRVQRRWITPFFDAQERALVAGIVSITPQSLAFVRQLSARLAANGIVCMAGDVATGHRQLPMTFLGIPKRFPTGAVTLAKTTGASILPTFCLRGRHRASRVVIEPPIHVRRDLESEAEVEDVLLRCVRRLEHYARRYPSLYLNWHAIAN
jgi:lauroyl/myristoyl acyltransferase